MGAFRARNPVRLATWRSGDAADCKSVHPGSIPGVASKTFFGVVCRQPIALHDDGNGRRVNRRRAQSGPCETGMSSDRHGSCDVTAEASGRPAS